MGEKVQPAERNAADQAAIQDLRTAASHLRCASAALSCAKSSVAAAYVEQALYYCQLELAQFDPTIVIEEGPG